MRRIVLVALLLLFPIAVSAPAFAGPNHPKKPPAGKVCKRVKRVKNGKRQYKRVCKPKKRGRPTPTRTPTPRHKHKRKPTATSRPAPTRTRTPVPTATVTATPTPTLTPTATATPTVTPTTAPTATATSSLAGLRIRVLAPANDRVAFYVCGLPAGAEAIFSPQPGIAQPESAIRGSLAYAQTTLITSIPRSVPPSTYFLPVRAYLEDASGNSQPVVPGAGDFSPQTAVLTVAADGTTTLIGSGETAFATTSCSTVPAGFGPRPTPTPGPTSYAASASISDPTPRNGEFETVTGRLTQSGVPLAGVPMHTQWYTYAGILHCDALTDLTGSARCTELVRGSIPTYTTIVTVTFEYNGRQYTAYTTYTT